MRSRRFVLGLLALTGSLIVCATSLGQEGKPSTPASTEKPAGNPDSKADKAAKAKKSPPLSLKDINQLKRNRTSTADIVAAAEAKGVDFKMTPAIQNQLRKLGFDAVQIEAIANCFGIEPLPPIVFGQFLRMSPEGREEGLAKYQKINKLSGANLPTVESDHVTIWAAKDVQPKILDEITKAEKVLETRFHEPIRSGVDKRTTHVIVLKTRAEYAKWIRAEYEVMNFDFVTPAAKQEALKESLAGPSDVGSHDTVTCLEQTTADELRRGLANDLGYMYFLQLSEVATDGALATGFGNGVEAALNGTPSVTIAGSEYGAGERTIEGDDRTWRQIVQSRIAAKKDTPLDTLLEMSTTRMELPNYAEAWSLVDFLARDRAKFAKLVLALRDEKSGLKAIETVYGWDEKKLTEQWHKHVLAK